MEGNKSKSSLEIWYDNFLTKEIDEYTDEDIGRCLRQDVQIEKVIPIAIDMLEKDPSAGYLYDGEILFALINLNINKWDNNGLLKRAVKIANQTIESYDDEEKIKIKEWIKKIKEKNPEN